MAARVEGMATGQPPGRKRSSAQSTVPEDGLGRIL